VTYSTAVMDVKNSTNTGASASAAATREPPADARATYRQLRAAGLDHVEAGNVTAYLAGLAPVETGWEIAEIDRLLFVRYMAERGRLQG
jgi:hypothetical protein